MAGSLEMHERNRARPGDRIAPLSRRLGWFVLIWVLSILALGAAAYTIRSILL